MSDQSLLDNVTPQGDDLGTLAAVISDTGSFNEQPRGNPGFFCVSGFFFATLRRSTVTVSGMAMRITDLNGRSIQNAAGVRINLG